MENYVFSLFRKLEHEFSEHHWFWIYVSLKQWYFYCKYNFPQQLEDIHNPQFMNRVRKLATAISDVIQDPRGESSALNIHPIQQLQNIELEIQKFIEDECCLENLVIR